MLQKNICVVVFLLLTIGAVSKSFAQADPQLSQFSLDPVAYNPAFAGINKDLSADIDARTQWVNITGHPVSEAFNISSFSTALHGGLGIDILNNQQGVQRNTFAGLDYALIISGKKSLFSIGIRGGIIQSELDGSQLRAPEGVYEGDNINHNDNILPNTTLTTITPNFQAGVTFKTKLITVGASVANLVAPSVRFKENQSVLNDTLSRNYFGYISFDIGTKNAFAFKPSLMFKSNLVENQGEVNLVCIYKKVFWFGLGYRGLSITEGDAAIALLGIKLNDNFSVGYSYDYVLSALGNVSSGSHEILLRYSTPLVRGAKPGKVIFTPRF